jgi:hypothetical protein
VLDCKIWVMPEDAARSAGGEVSLGFWGNSGLLGLKRHFLEKKNEIESVIICYNCCTEKS